MLTRIVASLAASSLLAFHSWISFYTNVSRIQDFQTSSAWLSQADVPEVYDFIVVGAGSAGSVVANRLSVNHKVLLLELGGDPLSVSDLPFMVPLLLTSEGTALLYETVPQRNAARANAGRVNQEIIGSFNQEKWSYKPLTLRHTSKRNGFQKVLMPRGTGLGGTSNLNAMIYQRGNPNDYDNWANITGDYNWTYRNVLKYFKKLEDYDGNYPNAKYHGTGGPIRVEKDKARIMEKYWLKAAQDRGYPVQDLNTEQEEGFASTEFTMKNGLRWSTYRGYIEPILKRKNLQIYRYSRVIKIHLDKKKHAYGVTYIRFGESRFARASKEIIISAGAIDSPKLLMLSGIGPKKHLNSTGIKCRLNLPVGKNLQDHVTTIMGPFLLDSPVTITLTKLANPDYLNQLIENYFKNPREGLLASAGQSGQGFVTTSVRNNKKWPEIQYMPVPFGLFPQIATLASTFYSFDATIFSNYLKHYGNIIMDSTFVLMTLGRPKSVGSVQLAGPDPFQKPLIQPNYYSHPDDAKAMAEGAKILVDLFESTQTFQDMNARLIPHQLPGCEKYVPKSSAYFECYVRSITETIFHPVGTVRMGKSVRDKRAVLDSKLRVLKTTGLRVIDASIMPHIVNANTNIPTIMIGEIGSDFIRAYWQKQHLGCPRKEYTFLFKSVESTCFYTKIV